MMGCGKGLLWPRTDIGSDAKACHRNAMLDLANAYRPMIGKTLDALAWRPMRSDTPGLVAELDGSTLEFTGAVALFFGAEEITLSWFNGPGGDYHLYACQPSDWLPFSLDLVHASTERPWGEVVGAQLAEVEFFTHPIISDQCVAARHLFVRANQEIEVWIGVGTNGRMGAGDDLLALVGGRPVNLDELESIEALRS